MTGWSKDGSGLLVKRVRGKTLTQYVTNSRDTDAHPRNNRRAPASGATGNADFTIFAWTFDRREKKGQLCPSQSPTS